ncbi:hypothetical protein KGQ20_37335 [Catenulispora sp. NF23]|uniref:Serine/threonine protein kinase n=1 Tax=Catenulispora pinistramenti TaxID=2705254 RepID=A0ABS5L6D1_9ACTN|nr:hypothetical protein [Catenulispora pinistramenti]MBS2538428.1 hypothetical protein [Catenulispora pinistramenti]MBS2553867.1 hypothetical protein [Catenulispora pinistramenti]
MEEQDVGRVFAAAAPETVPVIGDLPGRARALGKRRRRQRAFMTGAGAGVTAVAVAGAVVALGGFGSGKPVSATDASPAGPPSSSWRVTTTPATPSTAPSTTPSTTHSMPKSSYSFLQSTDNPVADEAVLTAVKAALPSKDGASLRLNRASEDKNGYGAEFTMGSTVLGISAGSYNPNVHGTPSQCAADPSHCTKGTATLQERQVRWEYYYGDPSAPTLNIYDDQGGIGYLVTAYPGAQSAQPPGLAEMTGVGLNEQVAAAELAAWTTR